MSRGLTPARAWIVNAGYPPPTEGRVMATPNITRRLRCWVPPLARARPPHWSISKLDYSVFYLYDDPHIGWVADASSAPAPVAPCNAGSRSHLGSAGSSASRNGSDPSFDVTDPPPTVETGTFGQRCPVRRRVSLAPLRLNGPRRRFPEAALRPHRRQARLTQCLRGKHVAPRGVQQDSAVPVVSADGTGPLALTTQL